MVTMIYIKLLLNKNAIRPVIRFILTPWDNVYIARATRFNLQILITRLLCGKYLISSSLQNQVEQMVLMHYMISS